MNNSILHIDSSAQTSGSASKQLSSHIVSHLINNAASYEIFKHDTSDVATFIDSDWIGASFTPQDDRTYEMKNRLINSDQLVCEAHRATHIVIGAPLYNFGIPASLKSWIDLISRPGLSFAVDDNGFSGLLKDKKAYLAIVSGSTDIEGPMDYATPYLKQILGFLGVSDITVFSASNLVIGDSEKIMREALDKVDSVFPTVAMAS